MNRLVQAFAGAARKGTLPRFVVGAFLRFVIFITFGSAFALLAVALYTRTFSISGYVRAVLHVILTWLVFYIVLLQMPILTGCCWHLRRQFPTKTAIWRRPASFYATEPLSALEHQNRGRRIGRYVGIGIGAGVLLSLVTSALELVCFGWLFLGLTLIWTLVYYPICGGFFGYHFGLREGDPSPSIRDIHFRLQSLMLFVAYVGLLLGLALPAVRLSDAATRYQAKWMNSQTMLDTFLPLLDKQKVVLERADANVKELREGRIPKGLLHSQKDFLKSLDESASPEYRANRYGIMADGEGFQATQAKVSVDFLTQLIDYYEKLAKKYQKAIHEPWLPVEPDPPIPK